MTPSESSPICRRNSQASIYLSVRSAASSERTPGRKLWVSSTSRSSRFQVRVVSGQRPHAQQRRSEGDDPGQRLDRDAKSTLPTTAPRQVELLTQQVG